MRVFCVCPAYLATGGTELLHQFCYELSLQNVENYMIYVNANSLETPTPTSFLKYNVKYVDTFVDAEDSVLILPEIYVHLVDICKKGMVSVWWLSVENYFKIYGEKIRDDIDFMKISERKNVFHFYQSEYAKRFLQEKMNVHQSFLLGDYINSEIIELAKNRKCHRENWGVYNPKKGFENLKPIIDACGNWIKWIPIEGMTPREVGELLCRSKIYIDFGSHPGKDRIPREAAICGCCILTNRRGSAAFAEDVPIPEQFKIEDMENVPAIVELIRNIIDFFDDTTDEYSEYRIKILNEKKEFEGNVRKAIDIFRENIQEEQVVFNRLSHYELLKTMEEANLSICSLLESAKKSCEEGEAEGIVSRLLSVDYLLQVMREGIYGEIKSLK